MMEHSKDLTLLYIEDDLQLLELNKKLFQSFFKSVESAVNGKEGLSKYKAYKKKNGIFYDLVITDIVMPKLDGLEMSRKMRAMHALQHIIIMTADNSKNYLERALFLGVSGFLLKPIEHNKLIDTLSTVSHIIYDYKFLISNLEILEDANLELEAKNRELLKKNEELEKSLSQNIPKRSEKQIEEELSLTYVQELIPDIKVNEAHKRSQIRELVNNDLYELKEILTEIDTYIIEILNHTELISEVTIVSLSKLFERYSSVLSFYSFFSSLSSSMAYFSSTIENTPLPQDKTIVQNIFVMLESFIYVLSKWHEDIASGDEDKINQFDASIISDIDTITNIWIQKESEEVSENSLDDIFDF